MPSPRAICLTKVVRRSNRSIYRARPASSCPCATRRASGFRPSMAYSGSDPCDASRCSWLYFSASALNFPLDIPGGFSEVLDVTALLVCTPEIFHGVADVEGHVLNHIDALHAGGIRVVMFRMIYRFAFGAHFKGGMMSIQYSG